MSTKCNEILDIIDVNQIDETTWTATCTKGLYSGNVNLIQVTDYKCSKLPDSDMDCKIEIEKSNPLKYQTDGKIKEQYDEFTKATTFTLSMGLGRENIPENAEQVRDEFLALVFSVHKENTNKIEFSFAYASPIIEWKYLTCHDISFLADGEPVKALTKETHTGNPTENGITEVISSSFAPEDFLRMARAEVSRGRLCNTTITFSNGQKDKMLEFAKKIGYLPQN